MAHEREVNMTWNQTIYISDLKQHILEVQHKVCNKMVAECSVSGSAAQLGHIWNITSLAQLPWNIPLSEAIENASWGQKVELFREVHLVPFVKDNDIILFDMALHYEQCDKKTFTEAVSNLFEIIKDETKEHPEKQVITRSTFVTTLLRIPILCERTK